MKYKIANGVWTPKKPKGYLIASIILLILTAGIGAIIVDNLVKPSLYKDCMRTELYVKQYKLRLLKMGLKSRSRVVSKGVDFS